VVEQKQASLLTSPAKPLPPLIQPTALNTRPSNVLGTPLPPLRTSPKGIVSPTSQASITTSPSKPLPSSNTTKSSVGKPPAVQQPKKRNIADAGLPRAELEPEVKRARLLKLHNDMHKLRNNSKDPVLHGLVILSSQLVIIGDLMNVKNKEEEVDCQLKQDLQDPSSELFKKLIVSLQEDPPFGKQTRTSFVRGYVTKCLGYAAGTQLNQVASSVLSKLLVEWRAGPRDFWLVRRLKLADMQDYRLLEEEKLIADASYVRDKAFKMYVALRALNPKRSGTFNLWSFFPPEPTDVLLDYVVGQIFPAMALVYAIKKEEDDETTVEYDTRSVFGPDKEDPEPDAISAAVIQEDALAHADF